uniref:Putative glycosyltransferase n=1 Tax=viral metagenome TaxID=1070528 RepID=A0A6M3MCD8_9ZZZZ
MKITVLSKMFNEEALLPFFLSHYSYADEILINLDEGTNDRSVEIIQQYSQAKIIWSKSTGKVNDRILIEELNVIASKSDADWLILVDSDELLFPQNFADPRETLEKADGNVIYSIPWQIYRHKTEADLDSTKPAIFQRRHGDPNRTIGFNTVYLKPNIIKPEIKICWYPGNHTFVPNEKAVRSSVVFDGAHWVAVDINISIHRRITRARERHSDENLKAGWGGQNFDITEEQIRADYELHKNDPQLF